MLINIVFLLLICSGSVYCAARNQHGFEEALPITAISIVFVVFVFGVCGVLAAGVVVCLILACLLYALSIYHLIRKRQFKGFFRAAVTPGSIVFFILFLAFSYLHHGRMACQWDEFSHWTDIVKVMTTLDDFGTNALSQSAFQSYPPGMPVFQYILQKLTLWLQPGSPFSEWRVYAAYQVLCLLPLIPIFKMCSFRRPLHLLLTCAALFLTPLLFFGELYNSVYIDPFIGLVSGAGLVLVLISEKKNWLYHGLIWSYCAILVLAKDVGMLFATFLMAAYGIDLFLHKDLHGNPGSLRRKLWLCAGALLACALPKLLWSLELSLSDVGTSFSGKIDFSVLINVILGNDSTYRDTVLNNYVYPQFDDRITLGHTTITVSYYVFFFLLVIGLLLLTKQFRKRNPERASAAAAVTGTTIAQLLVYIIGLLAIYLFKFSQREALNLAGMPRYLNMVYLSAWIVAVVLLCYATRHWLYGITAQACILCALLAISPARNAVRFIDGTNNETSVSIRAKYQPLEAKIHQFCDGDDRIFFRSQDDNGFDYWVSRFNARPNTFNPNFTWGIGETEYMNGMYAIPKTPEQWQQELLEGYDYVALYKLNGYFWEHYASLFENPEDIGPNCLYRVDRETGLLVKCQ